ncbi:PTS cellobiose transporter subunit IIC [Priestia filamentosa]|uniref:PTS cellobiose transporter subunit IIC n=1 Tax=Priestia filamentosa TaxID=1402861 RepID=UPI0003189E0D|nr:PTS cellobiose transporter subunit IIC [Priestia filamentosa]
MSKFNRFLEDKVMVVAGKVAGQRHLQALRDGLILTMPLLIIGSLFLILANFPVEGYLNFMEKTFGESWATKLGYPVSATFDIMALIASFGIAYRLAEKYGVDALSAGAISVSAFLLATPYSFLYTPPGSEAGIEVTGGIPVALLGSKGLFVAMILALVSTEIYRFIIQRNIVIKMPDGVPPAVSKSFVALIPGFIIITLVWIVRLTIENTSFESVHNIVNQLLQEPLGALGGGLVGTVIAVLLQQLLWVCGLHGATIVGGVMDPIWYSFMDENRLAFQNGTEIPNIVTKQFVDVWINMGGSGATFTLVVAMILFAKSQQMKQLGRLSTGPGIFNINEPVIFGMPVVLNPLMMVPFILTPVVLVVITYVSMQIGLVAKPAGIAVPWTTPPILSGYLATGGKISGAVIQVVNMAVAFLIYFPFLKMWDVQKYKEERQLEDLTSTDSNVNVN